MLKWNNNEPGSEQPRREGYLAIGDAVTEEVIALGEVSVAGDGAMEEAAAPGYESREEVSIAGNEAAEEISSPGNEATGSWAESNDGRDAGRDDWNIDEDTTMK